MEDLDNKKIGGWTVLYKDKDRTNDKHTYWWCKCFCGRIKSVRQDSLTSGSSTSCGLHGSYPDKIIYTPVVEESIEERTARMREFRKFFEDELRDVWKRLPEGNVWEQDFQAFVEWSIKAGYKPGLSMIVTDFDQRCSPKNCQWVDLSDLHVRSSHVLASGRTLHEFCKAHNLPYRKIVYKMTVEHLTADQAVDLYIAEQRNRNSNH